MTLSYFEYLVRDSVSKFNKLLFTYFVYTLLDV